MLNRYKSKIAEREYQFIQDMYHLELKIRFLELSNILKNIPKYSKGLPTNQDSVLFCKKVRLKIQIETMQTEINDRIYYIVKSFKNQKIKRAQLEKVLSIFNDIHTLKNIPKSIEIFTECNEKSYCSICMNMDEDNIYIKLSCEHVFHKECITRWFHQNQNQNQKCPLCRKEPEIHNIFKSIII
jgi:hypothetical protein